MVAYGLTHRDIEGNFLFWYLGDVMNSVELVTCHLRVLTNIFCDSRLPFSLLQAEKLMRQIGVKNVKLSEYEMSIAAHLVDPLSLQVNPPANQVTE